MQFDDVLDIVGHNGLYQVLVTSSLFILAFQSPFKNVMFVFVAGKPNHWCKIPELDRLNLTTQVRLNFSIPQEEKNGVLEYSKCKMFAQNYSGITEDTVLYHLSHRNASDIPTKGCSMWDYDLSQYKSTIVTEWDLVCDRKALTSTAYTTYIIGLMVCAMVYGQLADRFGRKPCLIVSTVGAAVCGTCMAVAPNYVIFLILRIVYSMFGAVLYQSAFIMGMELVGPKWRSVNGSLVAVYWSVGYVAAGGFAYLIRDWQTLQWAPALPLILGVVYIFYVPESPRWQLSKGRTDEAIKTIKRIAYHNGKDLPSDLKHSLRADEKTHTGKENILDLFRSRKLRLNTIVVCCHWSTVTMVYYGLSYNSISLGGNDYVNFAISGAIEFPGYLIGIAALHFIGRRWPLMGSLWLCGASLLLILAVPSDVVWAKILLAMGGKMFVSAAFTIVYVYSGELFPTVIRATGFNCGNFVGRVAGLIAPYLIDLGEINSIIPPIVMGSVSILGGITVLLVPETHNRKLPETIEDADNFGKRRNEAEDKKVQEEMVAIKA